MGVAHDERPPRDHIVDGHPTERHAASHERRLVRGRDDSSDAAGAGSGVAAAAKAVERAPSRTSSSTLRCNRSTTQSYEHAR